MILIINEYFMNLSTADIYLYFLIFKLFDITNSLINFIFHLITLVTADLFEIITLIINLSNLTA